MVLLHSLHHTLLHSFLLASVTLLQNSYSLRVFSTSHVQVRAHDGVGVYDEMPPEGRSVCGFVSFHLDVLKYADYLYVTLESCILVTGYKAASVQPENVTNTTIKT